MSSSYVEVRESENGTGGDFLKHLGINNIMATDSNGIDVQARFDAELPKDHTYNKDPDSNGEQDALIEDDDVTPDEVEESPKTTGRAHRNIKHKIIKPRTDETVVKKVNSKKTRPKAVVEPSGKKTKPNRSKSPLKNKVLAEVNNTSTPAEPEVSVKKDRKRKVEEVADSEVKEKNDKQTGRKRAKATPEKEIMPDLKGEEEEEKVEVKGKLLTKKLKGGKAKKKDSKSPKAEFPKVVGKSITKDAGDVSSDLPTGWTRKIVERKSGKSAGMFDIYIFSPDGIKFRSRPDIAAYLERTKLKLNLDSFSFKRSLGEQLTANNVKKPVLKTVKAESEGSNQKKKATSAVKSGKKLKVRIGSPKKNDSRVKEKKKKIYPYVDNKPSTSGLPSKRIGVNRKKKNT